MTKTAFLVDSTASISEELRQRDDVFELSLYVTWDGDVMKDTTDPQKMKDFYHHLTQMATFPQSSQPEPAQMIHAFEAMIEAGFERVIVLAIGEGLSGTKHTIDMIAQEYNDQIEIITMDTYLVSFLVERMLIDAIAMVEAGLNIEDIMAKLEWYAQEAHIYVVIPHLEHLVKGGRMSKAAAFIGNMLQIYPIIHFTKNKAKMVDVFEKQRTKKRAYKRFIDYVDEAVARYKDGIRVVLAHGDNEEDALWLQSQITKKHPDMEFRIGYLTPVVGVHGGKDSLGLGIMPKITY